MAFELLSLVEHALRVAKQALGSHAWKPESGGLPRETHIVAHCVRKEEGHSYGELVDRLSLMPDVCERLSLRHDALPDPTAFYHSFDRYAIYIWRALLRVVPVVLHNAPVIANTNSYQKYKMAVRKKGYVPINQSILMTPIRNSTEQYRKIHLRRPLSKIT